MSSKPPRGPNANRINKRVDLPTDRQQSPSNTSTSSYLCTRSKKSAAEVLVELPPAKRRKKAGKDPPDGKDDSVNANPAPTVTLGFPCGRCVLGADCQQQFHELRHKCAVCRQFVHMLCSRTVTVREKLEIGGKKQWLEEDDMVCKLCVPDEAMSEAEWPTQQSASEESGSKETGSEESASEESGSEESAYDDETSILTESVIVEKSAPTIESPKQGTKLKCSYSKCERRLFLSEDWPLVKCESCSKMIHPLCFRHFLAFGNKGSRLDFDVKPNVVCCATVRCAKKFKEVFDRVRWDSDGPNGPNTEPNSISILLDWWTTGNNYILYRGGKTESGKTVSTTKKQVWQELADLMKKQGITVERTANQIGTKICKIEADYRKAYDWLQNTGAGVLEEGGTIDEGITKRCKYFYLLDPIMSSRAAINPLARAEIGVSDEVPGVESGDTLPDRNKNNYDIDDKLLQEVTDHNILTESSPAVPNYGHPKTPSSSARRPLSFKAARTAKGTKTTDSVMSALKDSIHAQQMTKRSMKQAELDALNEWKEKELEHQKLWKSSELRSLRITALAGKKKAEAEVVLLQEQQKMAALNRRKALLLSRKELAEAGVPQSEIDQLLKLED